MAWQRKIPFGYMMKNGEIQCSSSESAVVRDIFSLYLAGASYTKIADEMMCRSIHYHKNAAEWNKHMVKRMLENKRYLGEKDYPAIVEAETFMKAQLLRGEKTDYTPCPDYIKPIREKAFCGVCGARMLRDTRSAGRARWYCESSDCGNRRYIEDEDVRAALTERLVTLAQNPSLIDWPLPRQGGTMTLEAVRIQNEAIRETDKAEPSAEYIQNADMAAAAEKYGELPDCTLHIKYKNLSVNLKSSPLDETICGELFHNAVKEIRL
jgi:hypothetical protein